MKTLAVIVVGAGLLLFAARAVQANKSASMADTGDALSSGLDAIINSVEDFMTPRGIRNNNPGNVRKSATAWRGQSAHQTDANFVQFDTPEFGIRALSRVVDTYATKYGLNTVRGIIERYAPPVENDTGAYVRAVADAVGVAPDDLIDVRANKAAIVQGIIAHENGVQPYTVAQIDNGVSMA